MSSRVGFCPYWLNEYTATMVYRIPLAIVTCTAYIALDGVLTRWAVSESLMAGVQPSPGLVVANTPPTPFPVPTATLKIGSRGARVNELQQMLQGLNHQDVRVSGNFDEATQAAVVAVQTQAGLPVDGRVGRITWQYLQTAYHDVLKQRLQAQEAARTQLPSPEPPREPPIVEQDWFPWLLGSLLGSIAATGLLVMLKQRMVKHAPLPLGDRGSSRQSLALLSAEDVVRIPDAIEQTFPPAPSSIPAADPPAYTGSPSEEDQSPFLEAISVSEADETPGANGTTRPSKVNIIDELLNDLHSVDPSRRRKAIWELGQRAGSDAIQPLVNLMIDSDSSQRSLILAAVSEIAVRTLKPINRALLLSLQDASPDVRQNAIRDVTRVCDLVVDTSQMLAHASNDPDADVRETANWALGQMNRVRTGLTNVGSLVNLFSTGKSPDSLPEQSSVVHLPDDAIQPALQDESSSY